MDRRTILLNAHGWQALHPHPADGFEGDLTLGCRVTRDGDQALRVEYRLEGDLSRLVVSGTVGAQRVDNLWKTTCLELFVAAEGEAYAEFNLAPGGAWAAYVFERYRTGGRDAPVPAPEVDWQMGARAWQVQARLILPASLCDRLRPLHAGLCAVIEWRGDESPDKAAGSGQLSYWAAHHAASRPDFHARESFILKPGSPS